jgi:Tfp pilus assembly protein PilF
MEDRAFCFLLGAGASRVSGIPTGGELVDRWLSELQEMIDPEVGKRPVEKWATAKTLGIVGFEHSRRADFYPQIFERRFGNDRDLGSADLERTMEGKEPSFGYSVLGWILASTRHNVVITTNFDNLVADALAIYTRKFPFVCGHELLTGFVRPRMRRPLVAKVHRDLLMAPFNTPEETTKLARGWINALQSIFAHYTPIVIGYGGNDGSLIGFLEDLAPGSIAGQPIWCYHGDMPRRNIQELVVKHRGAFVRISGFDELMILLMQKLEFAALDQDVESHAKERADQYREQYKKLLAALRKQTESAAPGADSATSEKKAVLEALRGMRSNEQHWWYWERKVQEEKDPDKKEALYREGLKQLPNSAELTGNFANFLTDVRQNHEEAAGLYRKAIELNPNDADLLGNYANFLDVVRTKYDEAEPLYRKALELNPNNATVLGNFANFLTDTRQNHDEAEPLYRKALELDSDNAVILGNYANFLTDVRQNHDEAERLYRKAIELNPNDATILGNFANFLTDTRQNHDEAERLYRKAIELDPNNATLLRNFSTFLSERYGRTRTRSGLSIANRPRSAKNARKTRD